MRRSRRRRAQVGRDPEEPLSDGSTHCRSSSSRRTATVWSGEATMVIARTVEGDIGVLRGHAPVLSLLARRSVEIRTVDDGTPWWPPSTAASSRSPTTGSRSCPSTPSSATRSTSRRPAPARGAQGTRRRERGRPRPGSGPPRRPLDGAPERSDDAGLAVAARRCGHRAGSSCSTAWAWSSGAGCWPATAAPSSSATAPGRQGRARLGARARALLGRRRSSGSGSSPCARGRSRSGTAAT